MNKFIVFVDFDGTITTRDTNEAILIEFTDGERWKVIEEDFLCAVLLFRQLPIVAERLLRASQCQPRCADGVGREQL